MLSVNSVSSNNYSVNFQGKGILKNIFKRTKTACPIVEKKVDLSKLPKRYKKMLNDFSYIISNPTGSQQEKEFAAFYTDILKKYGA